MPAIVVSDDPELRSRQSKALAHPVRYAMHELIVERPPSVGELSGRFPMSRWAAQKHISVLDGAALITRQRIGRSCLIGRSYGHGLSES